MIKNPRQMGTLTISGHAFALPWKWTLDFACQRQKILVTNFNGPFARNDHQ